ncbi:putative Ku family DNA helicase [Sphaerosporella brunnea]|uniref:ATP-dependent DNA helicase II subunit 2 n=1 Tax=Sphaerosporella brunnea TaxID=1250544 RepID=A0A5J5EG69_9PEZI|nr:putative Ku family DNA helicase [Sphaerosporella brunnea]
MADKQATIYIVDVGKSMGQKRHFRQKTDLEYALEYVWDRITTTISNGRKTDMIGVVGLRTDASDNHLAKEEGYENISILSPIQQFLMSHVRELEESLHPSNTDEGDGIAALILAIDMIIKHCKKLKYKKNIVFVTNGTGGFDTDDIHTVIDGFKEENINLTVLGVDFDDPEYGYKEENKPAYKAENEKKLSDLVEAVDGAFGTMAQAVEEMGTPRLKTVRPVASYKGKLTLGDPTKYDSAFAIDVERYPRTMVAKPVSASRYVVTEQSTDGESAPTMTATEETPASELQAVRHARTYQIESEDVSGGKMEIEKEEMAKGYKYGRTVVPISQADEAIAVMETEPSMDIVGFIPADKYKRYYHMSTTNVIVAQKGNGMAAIALSSLIRALYELDSYALVRFVKRKNDAPVMMVLAPEIGADFECLIDVQVPFLEDVRPYRFPPLGTVKTVKGQTLDKHRNIPTDEMNKLMSDYVDSMDLSEWGKDDDDESAEYAPIDSTFSPIIHRINQVIKHRAIHPKDPLPEPYPVLTKYSHPPEDLVKKSQAHLEKLINACDVKKVEAKVKNKKRKREQPKPISVFDLEAILESTSGNKKAISLENSIPEFRQKLGSLESEAEFRDLGTQMFSHAKKLITTSLADINYGRACEIIRAVREEFLEYDFAEMYNSLLRDLKKDIVEKKLDGDRTGMWWTIRKFSLGLITKDEADGSEVTEEQAKDFLKL